MTKIWRQASSQNVVLDCDGFFISYNANPGKGFALFDGGGDETALVVPSGGGRAHKYLILNGDFREEYEKCTTLAEAIAVFMSHARDHRSSWSDEIGDTLSPRTTN